MNAPKHPADVRDWLNRALVDLRWARYSYEGAFLPQACFACQQAAEKALKSFLLANDQPLVRTHSLPELLRLCEPFSSDLERFADAARVLDTYYAPTRYADVTVKIDYTEERVEDALARAQKIVAFLEQQIEARLEDR